MEYFVRVGLLSKRPSLIIPFSGGNQQHGELDGHTTSYLDDFQAPISKSGVLIKQANHFKTWKKRLMVLKGHSLFYYVSGTVRYSHDCVDSTYRAEARAHYDVFTLCQSSRARTRTPEA